MTIDALGLTAIHDEITPLVVGAQVQQLAFPDPLSLGLGCYAPGRGRTNVLLTVDPDEGRVQAVDELGPRGVQGDTPFLLLARKHLRDGRIREIHQPRLERVLELVVEQRSDQGQHYRVRLIVEVMGRRGNLLLVGEDGLILDALRRTPPSRNPIRPVLPHLPYVPPPTQDRLDPSRATTGELADRARGRGGQAASLLQGTVAGLSPTAAREIVFRATGRADTPTAGAAWDAIASALAGLLRPLDDGNWEPTVAVSPDGPVAYAPYSLTHLVATGLSIETFPRLSAAMARYYSGSRPATAGSRGDPLSGERRQLRSALDAATAAAERRVAALEREQASAGVQDDLRQAGELILAYQSQVQAGSSRLEVDGQTIDLDPELSAVENAQRYFARYRKARETAARTPELIEEAHARLEHLANLRALAEVADTPESIRALRREIQAATGASAAPAKASKQWESKAKGPFRRVELGGGWECAVGASASGNAAVTFDLAGPDDLWLHVRGMPGAHVILRGRAGESPPEEAVRRAAEVAAWQSPARGATTAEVDIAPRRYVRKVPGGPPGLVRYTHERTIRVQPHPPTEMLAGAATQRTNRRKLPQTRRAAAKV